MMLPKSRRIAEPHAGTDRTRPATRPKVASGSTPEATNVGAALYRRIIATEQEILDDFPELAHEDLLAVLAYAADRAHQVHTLKVQ